MHLDSALRFEVLRPEWLHDVLHSAGKALGAGQTGRNGLLKRLRRIAELLEISRLVDPDEDSRSYHRRSSRRNLNTEAVPWRYAFRVDSYRV